MKILLKNIIIILMICFVLTSIFAESEVEKKENKFANWLAGKGINLYLVVMIIAMLPIFELRGAIPVGIKLFELNIWGVIIMSLIGNMLPIIFILFLLKPFEKLLRKVKIFDKFLTWLFARTKAKSASIEKYEEIGLMLFVGIPLPMTGAWTGALAAYIFKLSYLKSLIFIFLGVLLACILVTLLTVFWYIGLAVVGLVSVFFIFVFIKGIITSKKLKK